MVAHEGLIYSSVSNRSFFCQNKVEHIEVSLLYEVFTLLTSTLYYKIKMKIKEILFEKCFSTSLYHTSIVLLNFQN